jgi:hypothetical protein
MIGRSGCCVAGALLLSACATAGSNDLGPEYRYAGPDTPTYVGDRYDPEDVGGQGAQHLDPWLSGTLPGQQLVLARFDRNYDGRIGWDRAGEANRWFRRFADRNRDMRLTDREINRGLAVIDRELGRRDF